MPAASAKSKVKLTDRAVTALKPPAVGNTVYWDTELRGFGVRVSSTGRKTFFAYYRTLDGRQRKPTVGTFNPLTTAQARDIANDILADVRKGEDPAGARQRARLAETITDLGARYLEEYAYEHKKKSTADRDKANIENHIDPLLGNLKIGEVVRADVEKAMRDIAKGKTAGKKKGARPRGRREIQGGPIIANRVVALLSKMFNCAIDWGLRADNPATRIKKYPENQKERFLSLDEISRFHDAIDTCVNDKTITYAMGEAIRLLLLTGMRRSEVTSLRWAHVDLEEGVLMLADTKTGAREVVVSDEAVRLLKGLLPATQTPEDTAFVFASERGDKPLALTRPFQHLRTLAEFGDDVTLHTLRHTFATWSMMEGNTTAQTGAALGHKSAQTTMRYEHKDRHSMRRVVNQVSAVLEPEARSGEKVVSIRGN